MTPVGKLEKLKEFLQVRQSAIVAFSGGVDSAFLLHVAKQVMGDSVLAVTFDAGINSRSEVAEAQTLARSLGTRHRFLDDESLLQNDEFLANPPRRCYICKKVMMGKLKELAGNMGITTVMDGSNAGDLKDFRPGMQAAREMGILSPLQTAGLKKDEIRLLSRRAGLPVWDKPSSPCLCSRIPYGQVITGQKLNQVEKGESLLHEMGFKEVRLRHHGDLARIELPAVKIPEMIVPEVLNAVNRGLKQLGFKYIALDLEGFRSGSLNETL